MHAERRHKQELTRVHPGPKGREEEEQVEPAAETRKQQLEKGAPQGRAGRRAPAWEGEMSGEPLVPTDVLLRGFLQVGQAVLSVSRSQNKY